MSSVDGRMQEATRCSGGLVGSILSGLSMQPFEAAGPHAVGEQGPICFAAYDAPSTSHGYPAPDTAGFVITWRRSYNLIELIDRPELISA
jgi:hypothetical protein